MIAFDQDLNRLERLIAIYHYLNQHATNTHNVAEEDIAGLLQKLYDAMVVPSFFLTADYELSKDAQRSAYTPFS